MIALGRSKTLSWSSTTPRTDTSDMWQETLNEEETRYFVDGEWRDLEIITEEVKVKGKETLQFVVKQTHRGSLFNH